MEKIVVPEEFASDEYFVGEWCKMMRGEVYDAAYPRFAELLKRTRVILWEYNSRCPEDTSRLDKIIRDLLGSCGEKVTVIPPFRCDFGFNIHVGENFFANFNFTVLDEAEVRIGDNVFIGPDTSIYTACHPLDPQERNKGVEWAEPVTIGNNVWIGGGTRILPGMTIGDNTTIGAGSVVTKDIPSSCVAVGNPCRVIRRLDL